MKQIKNTIWCAIYTHKSHEEGLDQDFNSLHAQRETCEAYILSQRCVCKVLNWLRNVVRYQLKKPMEFD